MVPDFSEVFVLAFIGLGALAGCAAAVPLLILSIWFPAALWGAAFLPLVGGLLGGIVCVLVR